jgi:hypothetical protein
MRLDRRTLGSGDAAGLNPWSTFLETAKPNAQTGAESVRPRCRSLDDVEGAANCSGVTGRPSLLNWPGFGFGCCPGRFELINRILENAPLSQHNSW